MKKILLFALTFVVIAFVASYVRASNDPVPIDLDDCEDMSEIPPEFEAGDYFTHIPYPGYMIQTTCGEAILGCILTPVHTPGMPDEYACVYVGGGRCYLAQTTGYDE